jgi:DNA polymerase-3 subunit beta
MRGLPDEMITVDTDKENRITITDPEGKKYKCTAESAEAYPGIPKVDKAAMVKVKRDDLRRIISRCLFAVSKDELRPQLTGVYLQVMPDRIRLVTTDGHRLVKVSAAHEGFKGDQKDAIVPSKAMSAVQRIAEGEGDVEISFAGSQLSFLVGNTRLITRLIEGRYPNYEAVIPTENKNMLKVDTDTLSAAVRRAAIFSNEISRQIRMKVEKEKIQISVEDVEQGNEGSETVPCEFAGESMDIGYNAGYVMDMLRQIDTSEVQFELGLVREHEITT